MYPNCGKNQIQQPLNFLILTISLAIRGAPVVIFAELCHIPISSRAVYLLLAQVARPCALPCYRRCLSLPILPHRYGLPQLGPSPREARRVLLVLPKPPRSPYLATATPHLISTTSRAATLLAGPHALMPPLVASQALHRREFHPHRRSHVWGLHCKLQVLSRVFSAKSKNLI